MYRVALKHSGKGLGCVSVKRLECTYHSGAVIGPWACINHIICEHEKLDLKHVRNT